MKRVSHTPPLLHPQFWMFLASLAQVWQEDIPCDARKGRGNPDIWAFCQPWGQSL